MRTVLSICAVILLIAGAWGQSTTVPPNLPPGLPPLGPLQTVTSPKVEQYRLPNGMQVWLVHRPGLPKVALTLLLRGGDSADPQAMPGLAQVLAATVTQGTTTRSAKQIADSAEFIGGDLSASADVDSIQLSIDPLSEYVNNALALLKDVSQNAAFAPEEVALVTSNLNNARMGQQADPLFLARRATAGIFYPQHPYRILSPSATTLRNATPDSLRALYRQTFRPDGALLIAVGEFDPKAMRAQIETEFGAWKAVGPPFPTIAPPQTQVDHRVYIVDRPHSVQTTMLISAPFADTARCRRISVGARRCNLRFRVQFAPRKIFARTKGTRIIHFPTWRPTAWQPRCRQEKSSQRGYGRQPERNFF